MVSEYDSIFEESGPDVTMVFCAACGDKISKAAVFCPHCGQPNLMKEGQAAPSPAVSFPHPNPVAPSQQLVYGLGAQAPVVGTTAVPPRASMPMAATSLPHASPKMTMGKAISSFFRNYATFSGRARRSEFWFVYLFVQLVNLPLVLLSLVGFVPAAVLSVVWSLVVFIPTLAVSSRRLHDVDKSFGWYFISLVPIVGIILVIVYWATDSTPGPNRFGSSLKYMS